MVKYILGDSMEEHFILLLQELNLELSDKQLQQFDIYYKLLIEWNNKLNLTSITDKSEVYMKHFYDSLCLNKAILFSNQTLLDVGSGAGFPSIPLKIVYPDLQVTILDALQKRIGFLEYLTKELDLNVELIHGRAEDFSRHNSYDIVTARAVANLQVLSELCIPFVKPTGYFLGMKGPQYQDELQQSRNTFKVLGARFSKVLDYSIEEYTRTIIIVEKMQPTSEKYPRKFSKIKSKPL